MSGTTSHSKLVRLIDEYDLHGLGDELEERWTRTEDRQGLRQLAEYVDLELLRAALDTDDVKPLEGEVENTYRLLTDEDVSAGVKTQTRNRLEKNGVDVDQLERDFVSKQAVHTYLTGVRNVDPPGSDAAPAEHRDRKREAIQSLKHRLVTVAERALSSLVRADRLTLGDFDVVVSVRVHCADCRTQLTVADLLEEGACDCGPARE